MGTGSRDVIAVWIYEGVIYVGNTRIYEYEPEYNKGFIIEKWDCYYCDGLELVEWETNSKKQASELATRISSESNMPIMAKWE